MKVLYRMEKNPYTGIWNCMAVFPELRGSYGRIPCYCIEEGWNECTYEYYRATRKAKEEEYKELHEVVNTMFKEDEERVDIVQKITTKMYEEMCRMWRNA